jgi:hypothetical protein
MPGNEEGTDIQARQLSKLTLNTSLEMALCHGVFSPSMIPVRTKPDSNRLICSKAAFSPSARPTN